MFDRFLCGSSEHCGRTMHHNAGINNDDCFRPAENVERECFVKETRTSTNWHRNPECSNSDQSGMMRRY